jgi:hypothetical protein
MIPINEFINDIGAYYEDEHGILFDSLHVSARECVVEVEEDDVRKEVKTSYFITITGNKEKP